MTRLLALLLLIFSAAASNADAPLSFVESRSTTTLASGDRLVEIRMTGPTWRDRQQRTFRFVAPACWVVHAPAVTISSDYVYLRHTSNEVRGEGRHLVRWYFVSYATHHEEQFTINVSFLLHGAVGCRSN